MLEPKEDKGHERSSLWTPDSFETEGVAAERLVYKLVRVGEDGTVLPATEDEVIQVESLVKSGGAGLAVSDAEGSDANEAAEEEEGSDGSPDSDEDGSDENEDPASTSKSKDPAVERKKLLAQLEVLETMLLRVEAEEQQRTALEVPLGSGLGHEGNSSPYLSPSDGNGDNKRQRRPNPKYFDFDAGNDLVTNEISPPMILRSGDGEAAATLSLPEKEPLHASVSGISSKVNPGWDSHGSSVRAVGTQRARTVVAQKPFTRTSMKVEAPPSSAPGARFASHTDIRLDNLSIRELHEAFRTTYGRETSVKDKHWLKRQISAGWSKRRDDADSGAGFFEDTKHGQLPSETAVIARLHRPFSAEPPLPSLAPGMARASERGAANGAREEGTNGNEPSKGPVTRVSDSRQPHRRTLPLTIISPGGALDPKTSGSLNGIGAGVRQIAIFGEEAHLGDQVGSKRQRKPNRRYIEEGDGGLGGAPANGSKPVSIGNDSSGNLGAATRLSWRVSESDVSGERIGRPGTLRGSRLRNVPLAIVSHGLRTKHGNGALNRKVEGRATKLVKMAHSARAARRDTLDTVRKVKFRLPAAPGGEDGSIEANTGTGDQVSCLLPVIPVEDSGTLQPDSRADAAGEQPIATVPTANGGTRRKHHRPWTLREVMTLVEGVARCGGGKWADIKKLAFASVGYRTAVDLKDKWRNLLRASRAQLHPPKQGERKKQFTAAIPAPILARVRELASLQNQTPPSAGAAGSTSRSGRTVHRK